MRDDHFTIQYAAFKTHCLLFHAYVWGLFEHTEAETRWLPFCRRHFKMHFLESKLLNSKWNFLEIRCLEANWQLTIYGSDNGLSPSRWQPHYLNHRWHSFTDAYIAKLGLDESGTVTEAIILATYTFQWLYRYCNRIYCILWYRNITLIVDLCAYLLLLLSL